WLSARELPLPPGFRSDRHQVAAQTGYFTPCGIQRREARGGVVRQMGRNVAEHAFPEPITGGEGRGKGGAWIVLGQQRRVSAATADPDRGGRLVDGAVGSRQFA